jgi:glycyl-tRNA synthetase beta chain
VARQRGGQSLLQEVPDLVEYPKVVSGVFAEEFLSLPDEVLTTTMIHHQHFFPLVNDHGKLQPVFLAVLNMEGDKPEQISRNLERVLTARLRDARFFFDADRRRRLDGHVERLRSVLFHKQLGSYAEKAERVSALAAQMARDVLDAPGAEEAARIAGRLAKADLATDMVREMTDLQGTMGGIYAREEGQPEEVWKAIYYHYLPVGVEADAPPTREQLGAAATTWAAVSLADKLDTVVGLIAAGERPTGSRDPYGLRRAAQGIVRTLVDLPELTGRDRQLVLRPLVEAASRLFAAPPRTAGAEAATDAAPSGDMALWPFLAERVRYVLEQRGYDIRNVRAVTHGHAGALSPLAARRKLEVMPEFTATADFRQLATLFKRVRNIVRDVDEERFHVMESSAAPLDGILREPAEVRLLEALQALQPVIEGAVASGHGYRKAFGEAARLGPVVATFFDEVLVMAEDPTLREARRRLMKRLEMLILQLADVSEMVPEENR